MQSTFSYTVTQEALKIQILDEIAEVFAPDLNSMMPQDKQALKVKKKESTKIIFTKYTT